MRVSLMKCGNDDKLVYIVDSTRVDNKIKTIISGESFKLIRHVEPSCCSFSFENLVQISLTDKILVYCLSPTR